MLFVHFTSKFFFIIYWVLFCRRHAVGKLLVYIYITLNITLLLFFLQSAYFWNICNSTTAISTLLTYFSYYYIRIVVCQFVQFFHWLDATDWNWKKGDMRAVLNVNKLWLTAIFSCFQFNWMIYLGSYKWNLWIK